MKKTLLAYFFLLFFLSATSQNLETILEKHFENKGQKRLSNFNTMIVRGESQQQGQNTSYTLMVKRPAKMRLEVDVQGQTFIQAYDGQKGWSVMPWTGSTEPVELTGAQLYGIQLMGDMDSPLYNWQEKGFDVQLKGEKEVKGRAAYHIAATINADMQVDYYIGKENYMILKEVYHLTIGSQKVEQVNYYSEYKPVEGVMNSFSQETGTGNQIIRSSKVKEVIFGAEISDDKFDMPAAK